MRGPDTLRSERQAPPAPHPLNAGLWVLSAVIVLGYLFSASPGPRHEPANRAKCSNNLRQIGLAIHMYASENKRQYPPELAVLIPTEGLSAEVFVCPASNDTRLDGSPAQQAASLLSGDHCSYVYIGRGMTDAVGADHVVAFELPENHSRAGGNVLYGDAHVEWLRFDSLVQLVPEIEAGHNPPMFSTALDDPEKLYQQRWLPRLASLRDGSWAAGLPAPSKAR